MALSIFSKCRNGLRVVLFLALSYYLAIIPSIYLVSRLFLDTERALEIKISLSVFSPIDVFLVAPPTSTPPTIKEIAALTLEVILPVIGFCIGNRLTKNAGRRLQIGLCSTSTAMFVAFGLISLNADQGSFVESFAWLFAVLFAGFGGRLLFELLRFIEPATSQSDHP
jgi:hypothetical protein